VTLSTHTTRLEGIVSTSRDYCLGQLDAGLPPHGGPSNRYSGTPTTAYNEKITQKRNGFNFSLEYGQFFKKITLQTPDVKFAAAEFSMPVSITRSILKDREDALHRHRVAKLASLLYLASVRVDSIPEMFSNFTLEVNRALTRNGAGYAACGEELLHALFKCVSILDPQKCIYYSCLLSRLLCASRSLPRDSWDTTFAVLSYFLSIPYGLSSMAELNN